MKRVDGHPHLANLAAVKHEPMKLFFQALFGLLAFVILAVAAYHLLLNGEGWKANPYLLALCFVLVIGFVIRSFK